jgi:hypothetical protein
MRNKTRLGEDLGWGHPTGLDGDVRFIKPAPPRSLSGKGLLSARPS